MNKTNRKRIDTAVRHLFRVVSMFSVVALVAMLFFVFYQGVVPFFTPTAESVQVVVENIGTITVNGTSYEDQRRFISIDRESEEIRIEFDNRGNKVDIVIAIDMHAEEAEDRITFPQGIRDQVENPELDSYTISWPGMIVGMEQRVHPSSAAL
jgi:hypothetical protein